MVFLVKEGYLGKFDFELPKVWGLYHSSGQGIPERDGADKKGELVNIDGGIWSEETKTVVLACSGVGRGEEFMGGDCYKVGDYFVDHAEPSSCTALLECFPPELVEHVRDAAGIVIPVAHIPGSAPLDHLDPLGETYMVWVPYCAAVLKVWPDQGLVGSLPTYF